MKKFTIAAAATAVAMLPLLAMAQAGLPANVEFVPVKAGAGVNQIIDIIKLIARIMLYALLVLASIFIVYAAYLYLTAAGDPEKVKTASSVIIYAAVAIGVGLLAQVIVAIAEGIVRVR